MRRASGARFRGKWKSTPHGVASATGERAGEWGGGGQSSSWPPPACQHPPAASPAPQIGVVLDDEGGVVECGRIIGDEWAFVVG